MDLAKFVQEQRKKHKLTKEFLASELGVSRPTYDQIELGEKDLTIPQAEKLAEIFGIDFEVFLRAEITPQIPAEIKKTENPGKSKKETIRISVPQKRIDKFKQILLYILKEVGGKPNVGMTVIYKILYFIDFDYYEKYEEQMMGLVYQKNQYGPTPIFFQKIIDELVKAGDVEIIKSKYYKYPQVKYLVNPRIEPDLSILTGQEQKFIDWELKRFSDRSASYLSELSHKDVPWISTETGKTIDYESVFYGTGETSIRNYGHNNEKD